MVLKKMNKYYSFVENTFILISGIALTVMMFLVAAEIIVRKFGGSSIPGVFELSEQFMAAVTLLGIAYVQREKEHINIDIFTEKLPDFLIKVIEFIVCITAFVVLLVFAKQGFDGAYAAFLSNEHTIGQVKVSLWPGKLIVSISFLIASFRFLLDAFLMFIKE